MNTHSRIVRIVVAVMLAGALVFMSTSTAVAKPPAQVKLSAKLLDTKVKVNGKARVQGRLDVREMRSASDARSLLETVIVQRLSAGVWVDVWTSPCRPNLTFKLSISFSFAAEYTLRLYHPQTTVLAAAESETFVLAVLG